MGQSRDDQAVSGGNSLHSPFKPLVLTCHVSLLAKRPALVCFQIRSNQSIKLQLNYAKIEFTKLSMHSSRSTRNGLGYIDFGSNEWLYRWFRWTNLELDLEKKKWTKIYLNSLIWGRNKELKRMRRRRRRRRLCRGGGMKDI